MSTVERINLHVQKFPQPFQIEVLNFVEFLASKIGVDDSRKIEQQWSKFSIAQAMRGLEDEACPDYGKTDLRESCQ